MKNIYKYALIASAVFSFAACNDMIESSETAVDIERTIILTATREGTDLNTRSVRMDDGTTWWGPKEEISVFYGSGANGGSKFTSNNTTLAETTEFEGSISMSGNKEFWAIYPYSAENSCDGNSIVTVIPSQQIGSESNFSGDAFPAIGKSSSLTMPLWNICGGIKFFVFRSDIKSVKFKGNNNEILAGKVKVAFNQDGKPEVVEVVDGKTEVTLNSPDGSFKVGKYYYITLLPASLNGGFTMTFMTDSEIGSFESKNKQTVKRSTFGVLKNIDAKVTEWESTIIEPEYVDLGLGVKWATFNVGATKPEEYGDYFAWGETQPKSMYDWSTYKWCNGSLSTLTKYNSNSSYGTIDIKTVLDLEDDAAHVKWGNSWCIPTYADWLELSNNCSWQWTENYNGTGVSGNIVTSNKVGYTDKSIFLPAAGQRNETRIDNIGLVGYYWSSNQSLNEPSRAWNLYFMSTGVGKNLYNNRSSGLSVRPVYNESTPYVKSTITNVSEMVAYLANPCERVELEADIDLTGVPFKLCNLIGTFDGKGHTVTYELTAAGEAINAGLFASVNGTVKNLKVAGKILTEAPNAGGVAGSAADGAVFENCESSVEISGPMQASYRLGGIVGLGGKNVTLKNCINNGKIGNAVPNMGNGNAIQLGGIIGHLEETGVVDGCTNNGELYFEAKGTPRIGGMCGYIINLVEASFVNCTNNGNIKVASCAESGYNYVAGISGYFSAPNDASHVLYNNCVNTGDITFSAGVSKTNYRVGGIMCHCGSTKVDVNNPMSAEVLNCSNSGNITIDGSGSKTHVGGIIGFTETVTCIITCDGCTNTGSISGANGKGTIGGIHGYSCNPASTFTNFTIGKDVVMTTAEGGRAGLVIGAGYIKSDAFPSTEINTALTGKIFGGKIVNGNTIIEASSENYKNLLVYQGFIGSFNGVIFCGP